MNIMKNNIPILVLAFNRADHVVEAMKAIKVYQPKRLYLECDGPRKAKEGEQEAVEATRKAMLDSIDWSCEIKTLFREENMGCAHAVNDAITWFFRHEEYGIICEDDIILSPDFFRLCEELLPRYAGEEKIMQISARNTSQRTDINNSYVYAQCFHCWGWATWRRAWKEMDMSMSAVHRVSLVYLIKRLGIFRGIMMRKLFKKGYKNLPSFSSWATRWYLSILDRDGLVICPGVNLALNIGLESGTHFDALDAKRPSAYLSLGQLEWPLEYNDSLKVDVKQRNYDSHFYFINRIYGLKKKIRRFLHLD